MIKTGWWTVNFDITLEGEESIRFCDLDEASQEHILECIRDGYRQGEVVMETDDEEKVPEYDKVEILTRFGTLYIDKLSDVIANGDNKIRLYDSRQEYFAYGELEALLDIADENGTTPEEEYKKTISDLVSCNSIDDFLDETAVEVECTAVGWDAMAQYMLHNYHEEYETEEDVLKNEFINKIGKYYILLK